jgi:hypothetical protein
LRCRIQMLRIHNSGAKNAPLKTRGLSDETSANFPLH